MKKTKIEWADSTWNPVTGCFHGCEYCYARKIATRFGRASETYNTETWHECHWVTKGDGRCHELEGPIFDEDAGRIAPYPYEFDPTLYKYKLADPYCWDKPQNIFVCSMADLFGGWVPDAWIIEVFEAVNAAPQHNYMFLTKNPMRYFDLLNRGLLLKQDNVWYGTTVTSDKDLFAYAKGLNMFLSIEPLLGSFSPKQIPEGIKWVIIGAETGRRKGMIIPKKEWIDAICAACDKSGIPVFMKDSLASIVGEQNMRREMPDQLRANRGEK